MASAANEEKMTALIMEKCAKWAVEPHSSIRLDRLDGLALSAPTRLLWRQQASSQQVQVGEREGSEQSARVLGQAAVAHLGKTPQALDHMKDVLAARPGPRSQPVDRALMFGERPARSAAVDAIADAGGHGALPVPLVPVGLIAKHLALLPMQQLPDLGAVMHVGRC